MPHITTGDGIRIFYQFDGDEGLPVVLLSNSLGTTLEMWDPQVAALTERYRVLRYDSRGHGQSDAPEGPYEIAQLGRDAVALLDALDIETVGFCGVSKGGMVGMWLGVHTPERIGRLVLANTSSYIGAPEVWNARIETVRRDGMAAIVPGLIDRWFTPRFQKEDPAAVERIVAMLRSIPPQGYVACCAAVRDMDQREDIAAITAPTLVISGTHDGATPPTHAQLIAATIPGAALVDLDAAHLSNIEQANLFNRNLIGFLSLSEASHG